MNVSQEVLFLLLLLGLGWFSKNQSIIIAVILLLVIRFSGFGDKIFPTIKKVGVDAGIIMIIVAVLIPIATGEIKLIDLLASMKSSNGIIALISGIVVALLAAFGIKLLTDSPQITTSLVLGTIFAVLFLRGVPVGPLIGAGVTMTLIKLFELLKRFII